MEERHNIRSSFLDIMFPGLAIFAYPSSSWQIDTVFVLSTVKINNGFPLPIEK